MPYIESKEFLLEELYEIREDPRNGGYLFMHLPNGMFHMEIDSVPYDDTPKWVHQMLEAEYERKITRLIRRIERLPASLWRS